MLTVKRRSLPAARRTTISCVPSGTAAPLSGVSPTRVPSIHTSAGSVAVTVSFDGPGVSRIGVPSPGLTSICRDSSYPSDWFTNRSVCAPGGSRIWPRSSGRSTRPPSATVISNGEYTATQPEKIASSSVTVLPAATVMVRRTSPASPVSTTSCRPGLTSASCSGVTPRGLPSTTTRAPEGVDVTLTVPDGFRTTAGGGSARRSTAAGVSDDDRKSDSDFSPYDATATARMPTARPTPTTGSHGGIRAPRARRVFGFGGEDGGGCRCRVSTVASSTDADSGSISSDVDATIGAGRGGGAACGWGIGAGRTGGGCGHAVSTTGGSAWGCGVGCGWTWDSNSTGASSGGGSGTSSGRLVYFARRARAQL